MYKSLPFARCNKKLIVRFYNNFSNGGLIKLNHGNIKEIIYSLENLLNVFNDGECSFLFVYPILHSQLDKVKLLLNYKELAHYKNMALKMAIKNNQIEIIDYLLEHTDICTFSTIEIKEIVDASLMHKNMRVLQNLRTHQISYEQCQIENIEVKLGFKNENKHTLCPEIVTTLSPSYLNKINDILQFLKRWKEDDLLLSSLNQNLPINSENIRLKI